MYKLESKQLESDEWVTEIETKDAESMLIKIMSFIANDSFDNEYIWQITNDGDVIATNALERA